MPSNYPLIRNLVKDEQKEVEAEIIGEVPEWIAGSLYRNGPARYEYGDKEYTHLFDGHSCIHKFKVENGKVFYSNKFVESDHFKKVKEENRLYPVFGTSDPCSNLLGRFQSFYYGKSSKMDNTNVTIIPYGNSIYALTETCYMCKFDPEDLKVIKMVNAHKYVPTATTTIAHPHVEEDGGWIIMGLDTKSSPPGYNFIRYKGGEKSFEADVICENAEVIAKLPTSHSMGVSYVHSFGLSQNYIIYLETALVFDFKSYLIGVITNRSFADNLVMNKQWKTRIHLIDRKTGAIVQHKFVTDPMFIFHHTNAYEVYDSENNVSEIVVDVCAYDVNKFDIKKLTYKNMFVDATLDSQARRFIIPLGSANKNPSKQDIHCELETINPKLVFEFPIINYERYNTKPYTYFYGTNVHNLPYSVIKQNVVNKNEMMEFKYEDGNKKFLPSEPIFVERPGATSEDDGVLLVMVLAEDRDFLSIIDAKSFKEIARALLPKDVKGAYTFHGAFGSKAQFS
jgi:carotenoid cleavage dioxygenase-like enzyme